jgi:putative flippase GtrA
MQKKQYYQIIKHFFIYGFVGLAAMLIDFFCVYVLTEQFHWYYLYSIGFAFIIAALSNYVLQKKFTFKCQNKNYARQFFFFFTIGLIGMLINLIVVYLGTTYFNIWYIYGKLIATFLAFIWNYSANNFLTFRKSYQ